MVLVFPIRFFWIYGRSLLFVPTESDMSYMFKSIVSMLDQGRNPLDISGELNVPSEWVYRAIEFRAQESRI